MTAEDLRKAILQQAIQGKLVPQDPNDEPASILLERIREEKARLVKERKIKKDKNESIIYRGEDNSHYEKILATGEIKCIDDEIPFEIPDNWQWCRFSSLYWLLTDGTHSTPKYTESGIPFLSVKDMSSGKLSFLNTKYISAEEHRILSARCNPQKGDLLISKVGTTGIPLIIDTDNEFSIFVSLALVKFFNQYINEKFLLLLLSSPFVQKQIKRDTRGVGNKNWVLTAITNTLLLLPPVSEQLRIVDKIEEIQPLIDKYRVAQEQAEEMDKSLNGLLKKSILQYAIQGKLVPQIESEESASILLEKIQQEKLRLVKEGKLKMKDLNNSIIFKGDDNKYYEKLGGKTTEITEEIPYELPNNWVFVRLANLCWLDDGYKASGEKLPYMDAKYHRGKSEITYLTQGKVVEPPCKAILVDGENSGEIFNITEKGYLGSTFKILQISKCISEEWLHILLNTYRDLFKNSKVGAAIPHLNKNIFRNLIVGIPPIEEQQRITDRIEKLMKGIEGI